MLPQNNSPLLLNRQQAAELLGIDPKSFDKYIRSHPDFQCFMVENKSAI